MRRREGVLERYLVAVQIEDKADFVGLMFSLLLT